MSQDGTFLSRWSRRKLDANEPAPDRPDAAPPATAPADGAAREPELSLEDVQKLPRIEDLTASTDIGPFLRKGVPSLLRKAALRRMWELDPAIRDYVGDARDYAYDWNIVDGVPGAGPLLPTDDVGATLARMFDRPEEPGREQATPSRPEAEERPVLDHAAVETGETRDLPIGLAREDHSASLDADLSSEAKPDQASRRDGVARTEKVAVVAKRRHGSAIPL